MYQTPASIASQRAVTAVMRIQVSEIIGADEAIRRDRAAPFSPNE
jgi:hypothetical protein